MGCITKQFLNKTWILSDHSVPGPCLHMIFSPQSISTPKWLSQKNRKKYICACDDNGRYEVSKLDKNSDFYGFGPWFLDHNKHNKMKIYFFLHNSTHIFRKWKKKYFNNVLDTYICFQSGNFIQWVTFCPKRALIRDLISGKWVGIFGKKITWYQMLSFSTKYWKWRKFEDITPSLTLFCLDFSENG